MLAHYILAREILREHARPMQRLEEFARPMAALAPLLKRRFLIVPNDF